MRKLHIHNLKNIVLAIIAVLFLGSFLAGDSFAASSCVTCHTDEKMITENLSKDESKKSALQAGTG
jgi:hypothetical protein